MDVTSRICNGILGSLILCGYALSEEKPKIKIPEAKNIIKNYVEEMSMLYRDHGSKVLTEEEKLRMEERILKEMKDTDIYDFVE